MKKFILALALSLSASAFAENVSVIFPRIYNIGSSVQVQVWNHTDKFITCSGPIWMRTDRGFTYSTSYYDTIGPRFTSYRTLSLGNYNDRIRSVSHNVYCF